MRSLSRSSLRNTLVLGVAVGLIAITLAVVLRLGPSMAEASPREKHFQSPPSGPLTVQSSPQAILARMNVSHSTWQTAQMEITMTRRDGDGGEQTSKSFLQIASDGRVRLQYQLRQQDLIWISDGIEVLHEAPSQGIYTTYSISPSERSDLRDFSPPEAANGHVVLHPLARRTPMKGADYLFPTGIAQNILYTGQLTVLGEEDIAGRTTVIVQREHFADGVLLKRHIYWVDSQTGLILQSQIFSEVADNFKTWVEQFSILQIAFDIDFSADTFKLQPTNSDSEVVSPAEFDALVYGIPTGVEP